MSARPAPSRVMSIWSAASWRRPARPGSWRVPRWSIRAAFFWTLAGVIGLATIPSFFAYWTQTLWLAKLMFWSYIPAIYFFIGRCMALVLNVAPSNMRSMFTAWSVLVGNVFNLIVAPQAVGFMSDWFARGHGADAASLRLALLVLAPTGFWAVWHFWAAARTVVEDQKRAIGYATL